MRAALEKLNQNNPQTAIDRKSIENTGYARILYMNYAMSGQTYIMFERHIIKPKF